MKTALIILFFSTSLILSGIQETESSNNLIFRKTNETVTEQKIAPESRHLPRIENPRIVVKKSQRKLEFFDGEKLIKTYGIALGFAPIGDKEKEGDGKTPEGDFYIFTRNDKSKFYLSLGISYPNTEDAERGLKAKLITKTEYDKIVQAVRDKKTPAQNTKLGGEIYIHGGGISKDWTWGCIALKNEDVKEIFDAISVGTPVKIEP